MSEKDEIIEGTLKALLESREELKQRWLGVDWGFDEPVIVVEPEQLRARREGKF